MAVLSHYLGHLSRGPGAVPCPSTARTAGIALGCLTPSSTLARGRSGLHIAANRSNTVADAKGLRGKRRLGGCFFESQRHLSSGLCDTASHEIIHAHANTRRPYGLVIAIAVCATPTRASRTSVCGEGCQGCVPSCPVARRALVVLQNWRRSSSGST